MATTADPRDCALCGQNLIAGTTTTSINAGSQYLCAQCIASADRPWTEGTRTGTRTN